MVKNAISGVGFFKRRAIIKAFFFAVSRVEKLNVDLWRVFVLEGEFLTRRFVAAVT